MLWHLLKEIRVVSLVGCRAPNRFHFECSFCGLFQLEHSHRALVSLNSVFKGLHIVFLIIWMTEIGVMLSFFRHLFSHFYSHCRFFSLVFILFYERISFPFSSHCFIYTLELMILLQCALFFLLLRSGNAFVCTLFCSLNFTFSLGDFKWRWYVICMKILYCRFRTIFWSDTGFFVACYSVSYSTCLDRFTTVHNRLR